MNDRPDGGNGGNGGTVQLAKGGNGGTVQLVTNKTDQEKANEYRAAIIEAMAPVLKLLTDANREGLVINMAFSPNAFKQIVLTQLTVVKVLD